MHVGDDLSAVKKNRAKLIADLSLPSEPVWLDQVHSETVVHVDEAMALASPEHPVLQADASVTGIRGAVLRC